MSLTSYRAAPPRAKETAMCFALSMTNHLPSRQAKKPGILELVAGVGFEPTTFRL